MTSQMTSPVGINSWILVLIASALFNSAIAFGGGTTPPPKISETTGPMTMKFLQDVELSEEARKL